MLQFIYTGSVDKSLKITNREFILINLGALENFAEGILAIADKYAVMPLKEQCERYMTSIICKCFFNCLNIFSKRYIEECFGSMFTEILGYRKFLGWMLDIPKFSQDLSIQTRKRISGTYFIVLVVRCFSFS